MHKNETSKKVVEFAQSETKSTKFRSDYPVSEELMDLTVSKVTSGLINYAFERYFEEYYPDFLEFVIDHQVKEEKQDSLIRNLLCWRLLFNLSSHPELDWMEDYIAEHRDWFKRRPILTSWLEEWKSAIPKFYFVGYKHSDRVLVVVDMVEEKTLDVVVYDPAAAVPKKGEFVMGTLLPLGDELYFPIIDFYHFDFEAREEIGRHFHYYYEKYSKESGPHETFLHVLSSMLQIEQLSQGK